MKTLWKDFAWFLFGCILGYTTVGIAADYFYPCETDMECEMRHGPQ